jgi:hypothetical protein
MEAGAGAGLACSARQLGSVVELKAVEELAPVHFAVVRSYLRAVGREHGLILNFAKPKLEIKRVIAPPRSRPVRIFDRPYPG